MGRHSGHWAVRAASPYDSVAMLRRTVPTDLAALTPTGFGTPGNAARGPRDAGRLPYLPGLDGVRAIAVLAVLLFHLPASLLPGGFLGVDVFFVLSGFLITSLLLAELERSGTIGFRQFYARRARRLLPALLAVLAVSGVLVLTVARDAASVFRQDAISALTYTTNWWYIFDGRSYFEVLGRPPLLQHLWSLGIEEQFYLVWPAVCLFVWHRWRRTGVGYIALGGAVVGTVWMAWLAVSANAPAVGDTARVYFGADTHAMTVLAGAALATVWRPGRLPKQVPTSAQVAVGVAGVVSLAALVAIFLTATEQSGWLFRGGFLVVALASVGLIAAASHPAGSFGRALGLPVLAWLGTRSYGIYLWHWPIFLVTRPDLDLPYRGWAAGMTSLVLTFLVAEASYRWIEMPFRRGAFGQAMSRLHAGSVRQRLRVAGIGIATTATVILGVTAVAAVPAVDSRDYLDGATAVGAGDLGSSSSVGAGTEPVTGKKAQWGESQESGEQGTKKTTDDQQKKDKQEDRRRATGTLATLRTTAIGDSVLLGARLALLDALPRLTVDAAISRQPEDIIDRVRERMRADAIGRVVIMQIGTNGIPPAAELRDLLVELGDRDRVVLVNVQSPVSWMDQSNRAIDAAAQGLDHVTVADWAAEARGHGEYFEADGTHLTDLGRSAYVGLIETSLQG